MTGSASLEVPLPFPPGRGRLTPSLSLSYDSGAGNGVFGIGWSLSLPAIRRKTDKQLPRYRDATTSDTFVLSGFEDLVPVGSPITVVESSVSYSVQRYQPRIESGFALIQRWTNASTGAWRTRSAQNVLRRYGSTSASRTADPADATRIFAWYVDLEEDELGNVIRYVYDVASGASPTTGLAETGRASTYTYLKRVQYGSKVPDTFDEGWYFEIVLDYGEDDDDALGPHVDPTVRFDPFSTHKPGFDVRCFRLCARVLVFHRFATDATDGLDAAASLVKSLDFTYTPNPVATTLQSVTLTGYAADGTPASMPSLDFTYVAASPAGAPEFLTGIDDLPTGIDFSRAQWVDLDGEGLQGLLTEDGAGWWYKRNEGSGRLGAWRRLPTRPGPALATTQLADLDGDGRLEVFQRGPPHAGSWARTADGGWDRFRPFEHFANEVVALRGGTEHWTPDYAEWTGVVGELFAQRHQESLTKWMFAGSAADRRAAEAELDTTFGRPTAEEMERVRQFQRDFPRGGDHANVRGVRVRTSWDAIQMLGLTGGGSVSELTRAMMN